MHVLIAPNAFKNSLNANAVANAIENGLKQSKLKCSTTCFPVGDGGDGTAQLIIQHRKGKNIKVQTQDALGRQINSSYGLADNGKIAVIELANASGIRLLKEKELDPLNATTYGTGELIKHALDKNVNKIILCIGGSATVDGGTGILQALGIKFLNEQNDVIKNLPQGLTHLVAIDTCNFDKRILDCEMVILCDVENPLLGNNGAATIFGPQKGASAKEVNALEKVLEKFSAITLKQTGIDISIIKHGGAAGGVAAGLFAFCNAKLVNGIDYFLGETNFEKALAKADIVITGEGKIDDQTLHGKGPFGVAGKAKEKNIPVIGVAGSVPLKDSHLKKYFDILISINNEAADIKTAMENTQLNLMRTGKMLGNMLALYKK